MRTTFPVGGAPGTAPVASLDDLAPADPSADAGFSTLVDEAVLAGASTTKTVGADLDDVADEAADNGAAGAEPSTESDQAALQMAALLLVSPLLRDAPARIPFAPNTAAPAADIHGESVVVAPVATARIADIGVPFGTAGREDVVTRDAAVPVSDEAVAAPADAGAGAAGAAGPESPAEDGVAPRPQDAGKNGERSPAVDEGRTPQIVTHQGIEGRRESGLGSNPNRPDAPVSREASAALPTDRGVTVAGSGTPRQKAPVGATASAPVAEPGHTVRADATPGLAPTAPLDVKPNAPGSLATATQATARPEAAEPPGSIEVPAAEGTRVAVGAGHPQGAGHQPNQGFPQHASSEGGTRAADDVVVPGGSEWTLRVETPNVDSMPAAAPALRPEPGTALTITVADLPVPAPPPVAAQTASAAFAASGAWTSAPAHQDDVVMPQIVRAMHLQMRGGVGEARVQLDPQHLGAVTVALRVQGTMVTAVISAEQPAVRQWLETHEHTLRQALVDQGLDLHRLSVEEDEPRRGKHEQEAERYVPRRAPRRRETATFELVA